MIMKNYENLLQDLLFGAKDLINKANNVSDQFDMSIRLAEQVTKAIKVLNKQMVVQTQEINMQPVEKEETIDVVEQVHLALSKEQYSKVMGYEISQAAYDEYVDIFNRQAAGEEINLYLPDPDGIQPIPEGAVVALAIKESPMYKHLFEEKEEVVEEEVVEEETVVEESVEDKTEEKNEESSEITILEEEIPLAANAGSGVPMWPVLVACAVFLAFVGLYVVAKQRKMIK